MGKALYKCTTLPFFCATIEDKLKINCSSYLAKCREEKNLFSSKETHIYTFIIFVS